MTKRDVLAGLIGVGTALVVVAVLAVSAWFPVRAQAVSNTALFLAVGGVEAARFWRSLPP